MRSAARDLAGQLREHVGAVDHPVRRRLHTTDAEYRREQVGADHRAVGGLVRVDPPRPPSHAGHSDAALVHGPLPPAEATGAAAGAVLQPVALRPVVRREEHERRVGQLLLSERLHRACRRRGRVATRSRGAGGDLRRGRHRASGTRGRSRSAGAARASTPRGRTASTCRVWSSASRSPRPRRAGPRTRPASRPACRCGRSWPGSCGSARRCSGSPSSGRTRGRRAAAGPGR